jgi:PAS domain S-box-containing protein
MPDSPSHSELKARIRVLEQELARCREQDPAMIRLLSEDFKRLADRSQDAIYHFDIESRTFSFFNQKFLSLYAIKEKGRRVLSPKSVLIHIHPDDREKVRTARTRSYQAETKNGETEYRFLHDDGTTRIMHDRWTVVCDETGQPVAIEGFIRDNTRRREVEKEFELSIHNSLIGCYIIQDSRLKYVNPQFTRITGYSEEELLGTNSLDTVQPLFRNQVKKDFISMLKLERQTPYEFCITDKSGNTKWILETAAPIRYKGKRAALGYFMDVTESKQIEEERIEKEKLVSILELAGAVGHELNNPLQVVLTCSEKLAPREGEDQRRVDFHHLLIKNIEVMRKTIHKFQNITQYATKDYVKGKKILDIDAASNRKN